MSQPRVCECWCACGCAEEGWVLSTSGLCMDCECGKHEYPPESLLTEEHFSRWSYALDDRNVGQLVDLILTAYHNYAPKDAPQSASYNMAVRYARLWLRRQDGSRYHGSPEEDA